MGLLWRPSEKKRFTECLVHRLGALSKYWLLLSLSYSQLSEPGTGTTNRSVGVEIAPGMGISLIWGFCRKQEENRINNQDGCYFINVFNQQNLQSIALSSDAKYSTMAKILWH